MTVHYPYEEVYAINFSSTLEPYRDTIKFWYGKRDGLIHGTNDLCPVCSITLLSMNSAYYVYCPHCDGYPTKED